MHLSCQKEHEVFGSQNPFFGNVWRIHPILISHPKIIDLVNQRSYLLSLTQFEWKWWKSG